MSLELGGKAPYVVFEDADFEGASRAAIFGMFRNAGQACGTTTRLLIQESIHDSFLEKVVDLAREVRVGDPASESTDMGPVIPKSQEASIQEYVKFGIDPDTTWRWVATRCATANSSTATTWNPQSLITWTTHLA